MEAKHTKGPWRVHEKYPDEVWAEDGRTSIVLNTRGGNESEGYANARLIAAAPDLLAACEAMDRFLDGDPQDSGVVREQMRTAIARTKETT